MSSLFDMISSFIALLMSAAFLHFGAASGTDVVKADAPVAATQKATEQSSVSLSGTAAASANQPAPARATPAEAIRHDPERRS